MRRLRETEAPPARGKVSAVRVAPTGAEGRNKDAQVARGSTSSVRGVRPAEEAWARLAEPLRRRKGIRLQFYGITQYGKTTSLRDFLGYVQRENLIELTLIHDVKMRRPQYAGQIIHEGEIARSEPAERYPATYVLRRKDVDHIPDVEGAAKVVFESAYDGVTSLLVLDEQRWALTEGGDHFVSEHVKRLYCEGGGLGGSILATKQLPQHTPTDCHAQAELIFHRSADKVLTYLIRQGTIDEKAAETIKQLEVGEFIVANAETNYDGIVYRTPPPSRARPDHDNDDEPAAGAA